MEQISLEKIREQLLDKCIVNGEIMSLEEVNSMGLLEFGIRSRFNMPQKLYKYYSNNSEEKKGIAVNYSQESLKNNTVYMQTPTEFDDVYDSDITLDYEEFEQIRVKEYCRRCGVEVSEKWTTQEAGDALVKALWPYHLRRDLEKAFIVEADTELERRSNEAFCLEVLNECNLLDDFGEAVSKAIAKEYQNYSEYLKAIFRITCFTTTPYSQLMWGSSYANKHKGFCVEYTINPQDIRYQDVYLNLFPVVYCKLRPDVTKRIVYAKDKEYTESILWDIYFNGALRKSIDWAYQNEWRLLLPLGKSDEYSIKFFPISKVFLGNRMTATNRKIIIDICKMKGIPYVGVNRNPKMFEMQDGGSELCEYCERLNQ